MNDEQMVTQEHVERVPHSPGPWTISKPSYSGLRIRATDHTADPRYADRMKPAPELTVCTIVEHDNAEANARLIAAAPNLLAALKALMADIDSGLLVRDITRDGEAGWSTHMLAFVQRLHAAQFAVQKAEGSQP